MDPINTDIRNEYNPDDSRLQDYTRISWRLRRKHQRHVSKKAKLGAQFQHQHKVVNVIGGLFCRLRITAKPPSATRFSLGSLWAFGLLLPSAQQLTIWVLAHLAFISLNGVIIALALEMPNPSDF